MKAFEWIVTSYPPNPAIHKPVFGGHPHIV